MRKEGKKLRDIKFFSKKNDKMIVLHSEAELAYAQKLEDDFDIASYEYGKALEKAILGRIPHIEIRKEYFEDAMLTDFYIISRTGAISIREMTTTNALAKLAEVEKLELSRRYWQFLGITDWKVVI